MLDSITLYNSLRKDIYHFQATHHQTMTTEQKEQHQATKARITSNISIHDDIATTGLISLTFMLQFDTTAVIWYVAYSYLSHRRPYSFTMQCALNPKSTIIINYNQKNMWYNAIFVYSCLIFHVNFLWFVTGHRIRWILLHDVHLSSMLCKIVHCNGPDIL